MKKVAFEPMFLTHLRDQLGIRGVKRVVMHEPLTNLRKVIFLQFAHGTARTEIWRALRGASALRADCGKICVAVSEDIDPTNTDAVFWSLAYRSDPGADVQISPYRSAGHGPKSGQREDSTMLIDATLKASAPPLALPGREFMETRAHDLGRVGLAADHAAAAVARLFIGRLGRALRRLCAPGGGRPVGSKRSGNNRAAARRADTGNAGARRRSDEKILIVLVTC